MLREALKRMGRADLIGNGKHHLVPAYQPVRRSAGRPARQRAPFRTQHTGLPKSGTGEIGAGRKAARTCRDRGVPKGRRAFLLATLPRVRLKFRAVT